MSPFCHSVNTILLPITTSLDTSHEDVLGGHEWQFGLHVFPYHQRPDLYAIYHVRGQAQQDVRGKESLWQRQSV